jgi:raffinose/stachyose/melibiose transport system substrate-binding protein
MGVCLLAGCGVTDVDTSQSQGAQEAQQTSQRAKQSGQIEDGEHEALTICTANVNYSYFVDALHEKYPEINLEFISYDGANESGYMQSRLANGDIPDIYTCRSLPGDELQEKSLLNLNTYDFINSYSDTVLNDVDVDGNVYMIPSCYRISGINYNKTMFEEYGWEIPESFEEFAELVDQIKKDAPGVIPIIAHMDEKEEPFQYMFALGNTGFLGTVEGAKWKTDFQAGNANAVGSLESSVEYFEKWIDAGYITDQDLDYSGFTSDFYDGRIAMMLGTGTFRWSGVGESTGETIEIGIMAWPGENGDHGILLSGLSGFYGISSELGEPGNEQKLEDALKVLEFITTEEGQSALCTGHGNGTYFPCTDFEVDEDSPLYEVKDYIDLGYTVPFTYQNWEDGFVTPMADELIRLIQGELDTTELLERFDSIKRNVNEDPDFYEYAVLDENLTQEQTARLVGIAMIEDTEADVSLVSLGGITDDGNYLENPTGVQCGIYAGAITESLVNVFRPNSRKMAVVTLTGAEIQDMVDSGRELYADPEENGTNYTYLDAPVTYYMPYVLVTRDDEPLSADQTYRVVFAESDYSDRIAKSWGDRLTLISDESPEEAVITWLQKRTNGHFGASDLEW